MGSLGGEDDTGWYVAIKFCRIVHTIKPKCFQTKYLVSESESDVHGECTLGLIATPD
jgi:hypothetical protein